jgi:quercetin dioxygenase-like cupin family protein
MKLLYLTFAITLVAGCGSSPPASPRTPASRAAAFGGAPVRYLELPATAEPGPAREVTTLVDEPALKLVTIVLRGGTALPEHHAEVPVTIQALHGAGTVAAGGELLRIDPSHAVVLAAKVPHAVTPDSGTDLVLLVAHHGRATPEAP